MERQDIENLSHQYEIPISVVEKALKDILLLKTTDNDTLNKKTIESWLNQKLSRQVALNK